MLSLVIEDASTLVCRALFCDYTTAIHPTGDGLPGCFLLGLLGRVLLSAFQCLCFGEHTCISVGHMPRSRIAES